MPILTDVTAWRTHPQVVRYYAYVDNPPTVFFRSINQASFVYPVTEIAIDNPASSPTVYTDVLEGMTIGFYSESTGLLKGFARVKSATDAAIVIAPVSQGEIEFLDNDEIRVLDTFHIWPKIPRITNTGEQLKDWSVAFGDTNPQPPVAVIKGGWYGARLDATTELSVFFDGSDSFAVADGNVTLYYLWSVPSEGTTVIGSLTDSTITVLFEAGRYWLHLTVTDDFGGTHTAHTFVVVASDPLEIDLARLGGSLDSGWECSIIPLTEVFQFPQYTPLIVWAEESYDNVPGSLNGPLSREQVKFWGWTAEDTTQIQPLYSDVTINAIGPLRFLDLITGFSQITEWSLAATSWYQITTQTLWKHIHYILQWQSTFLDICPIELPEWYTNYGYFQIESPEGTLASQLKNITDAIGAKITIDKNGTVYLRQNPQLLDASARGEIPSILTLLDSDWFDNITVNRRLYPELAALRAMAIVTNSSAIPVVSAVAPGAVPNKYGIIETINNLLVNNQADLNQRIGKLYALRNRTILSVDVPIINAGLVADPAWQEFITFTMEVPNISNFNWQDELFLLESVELNFDAITASTSENWSLVPLIPATVADAITVQLPGATAPDGEYISSDGFYIDPLVVEPYDGPTWSDTPLQPIEALTYDGYYTPIYLGSVASGTIDLPLLVLAWGGNDPEKVYRAYNPIESVTWLEMSGAVDVTDVRPIPDTGPMFWGYVLTDSGLYVVSTLYSGTPTFTRANTFGGEELRTFQADDQRLSYVQREARPNFITYKFGDGVPDTITLDDTYVGYDLQNGQPITWGGSSGTWVSSPSHDADGGSIESVDTSFAWVGGGGYSTEYLRIFIDLEDVYNVPYFSIWRKANASGGVGDTTQIYNESFTWLDQVGTFNTLGTSWTESSFGSGEFTGDSARYLSHTMYAAYDGDEPSILNADDITIQVEYKNTRICYSEDRGSTRTLVSTGEPNIGDTGYDIDDFNLGVHIVASNNKLFYSNSYTGPLNKIIGTDTPVSATLHSFVRIPYYLPATTTENDTVTALTFIFGGNGKLDTDYSYNEAVLNASSGSLVSQTGRTIVESKWCVQSPNGFEFFGGDANFVVALVVDTSPGGTAKKIAYSTNGGVTWSLGADFDGEYIIFLPPDLGGTGVEIWASGADGIIYSTDMGATIDSKTGDFDGLPIGVYPLASLGA